MPAPLTAAIEAALASGGVNYVDLARIKLPGEFFYWSSHEVPEEFTGEGVVYEARIKSIGKLTFKAGFHDSTISVTFSNHDGLVKEKADEGITWERAEFSICRLFPDLAPEYNRVGTWEKPYWRGWIKQAPSFEDLSTMKVDPGFSEFNRPALRRFSRTDMSVLESEQFPYNPLGGKGLPQTKASGTATGGSANTLLTSDDISGLKESWLIFVKAKKIIGRIVSIGEGEVGVEGWLHGGEDAGEIIPQAGDSWIAGPVYTSYDGMESTCKNMGMFGPWDGQSENDLNTDTRRYFKALSLPGNAYLEKAVRVESLAADLFSSVHGEGPDGEVIPVRVGRFNVPLEILASGVVEDHGYFHVLGTIGEGRVEELTEPLLDGVYHVDNINPDAAPNDDSWIEGGTEFLWANDQAAVDEGELTQSQQKQAIGSRQCRARNHQTALDTYKSNPKGFNDFKGGGCSTEGLAWVRARFQKEGYSFSGSPLVQVRGRGIKTEAPAGTWTAKPDLIEFFYWYLKNQRWGAKLALDRLNVADFAAESLYAGEIISSASSTPEILEGTIIAGPEDADAPTLPPCCVIVPSTLPLGKTREDGMKCAIITATKTYTMTVRGEAEPCGPEIISWIQTPEGDVRSAVIQNEGWLLIFYSNFDEELPEEGDGFILSGGGLVEEGTLRYQADGSLMKDTSVGKMAEDIMRNCNGTFIPKEGRVSPVIRRAVDLNEVDSRRTYTDKGANRNVIFSGDRSTFKFTPADSSEIPTTVIAEFKDVEYGGKKRQIPIRNPFAEERIRAKTGNTRENSESILDLCLTGEAEQAVRLAALYLRRHSFLPEVSGYHPGEYSLEVPIHDAQDVLPMDVYPIHGGSLPYWSRYMRIEEIEDNAEKGTVTLKGSPYLEEMYRESTTDFIITPGPVIQPQGPGTEYQQLKIESLVEGIHRDDEGTLKVSLSGEITLP